MAKPVRSAPGAADASAPVRTETRNSPIPRPSTGATKQISHEMIAKRAYEISQSGAGGSEFDNWIRAERELRSGK